jgi:pyruvate dehydrogenase E2 component (dihydrolipoamide acetyltransferase)
MPSLGADMDAGTIVEWRIGPGDEVRRGDIVAVVDTDKADIEIESFDTGVVERILVPIGVRVPVGEPLAVLKGGMPSPIPTADGVGPTLAPALDAATISPVLRRLATHLGVDLATISGTGPGGRVTREDIESAAAGVTAPAAAPPAVATAPVAPPAPAAAAAPTSMRSAIAALMSRSAREIPHYHVATQIDLSATMHWVERTNLERSVSDRILPIAVLLKATALAARQSPELNGFWLDGTFQPADRVHLGIATSLRSGGLIAPALHDVDTKDVEAIMHELRDLVGRARAGRLRSSEMADPTLTVTNLGEQGVDLVHGLIYPPQVALIGFGRIAERPWAAGGMLGVRPVLTATLAADHRATDGMRGARFLDLIDHLLQEPEQL